MSDKPKHYSLKIFVNNHKISSVLIGRHYLLKHSSSMNDEIILQLVMALDEGTFPVDSTVDGIEYFVADVEIGNPNKVYRIIWLFEGEFLEVLGVINAYRRKKKRGQNK
ncbi:MAG: hypothetical protein SGI74_13025 [Oligoflexia bacterium]|nr:hypothetical protein [Oligoflexia bacterium]